MSDGNTDLPVVDTDVLVVGTGPTGSVTALALAQQGIRVQMITRTKWLANTPRAHITSQRTMEVFRDLGIEEACERQATPWLDMGDSLLAVSLTGPEFARFPSWGSGFERHGEYVRNSPCEYLDIPQDRIEPVLVNAAAAAGAQVDFNTEFLELTQDAEGVTSKLRNRTTGQEYLVRSKYLVGADGAKSKVAEQIGLPFEGHLARGGTLYTQFRCDLSDYVAHRPSILHWFFNPETNVGEIGLGLLRCTKPWTEWVAGWGFNVADGEPEMSDDEIIGRIRELVGVPDLEVEIFGRSVWYVNQQFATEYSRGRVFCGGDATHRHPPSSGLGLNTCVQDAHNLAWKLAYAIKGYAGPELLETYSEERAPVGKQIVLRANQSRLDYAEVRKCLITEGPDDPVSNVINNLNAPTPEGIALREQLEEALRLKDHEFNAEGVEKNQRYRSSAVLDDSTVGPETFERDTELFHQPTTRPGAKLPHAWLVDHHGLRVSTLDVVGKGRFTVLTGPSGLAWREAVNRLDRDYLDSVVTGVDPDAQDPYYDWHRKREIPENGALLVRPDGVVAWRHNGAVWEADEATELLRTALAAVLGEEER